MKSSIPIFPLSSITFPGGYMPLRIFETRYIDMVKNCVKNNTGFGISLTHQLEIQGFQSYSNSPIKGNILAISTAQAFAISICSFCVPLALLSSM